MFTLSIAMIVKNEELVLDRILNCAKKFADEIVIVDTGSTDSSIEIAKKYTDKIYHFEWCQDFAKARNFSFEKCTKEYIMWLDADDYIDNTNISKILELKNADNPANVYMFKYAMGHEDNTPTFEFFRERILQNCIYAKWHGFVHEAISPWGKIDKLDITIEHRKLKDNPPKRNLKLYYHALRQGIKFSAREQYYYARELYYNTYYKKAIIELKKYLRSEDKFLPNIIGGYTLLCESFIKTNQIKYAIKYATDALRVFTPNPEFCCLLARIFEANGEINKAIFWYNTATFAPEYIDGFIQKDYKDFVPYLELSRLLYPSNKSESKKYYLLAKKIHPHHPAIKFNYKFFK